MRLKDLRANQVPFWYQTYEGMTDLLDKDGNLTGERVRSYSKPVRVMARVAPNSGDTEHSPFGADIDYDRSISTVQDLPIDRYSVLFIDVTPELDNEGNLAVDEDGNVITPPDFWCVIARKDLQQRVWAIKQIKAEADNGQNR